MSMKSVLRGPRATMRGATIVIARGSSTIEYPEFYTPKPYSRSFVLHIDNWYAQSHPDEDFAETFAVWLNPRSEWRRRYQDWPALKKLEYMDELMREIASLPPLVDKRRTVDPLHRVRRTLRQHYKRKAEHYALDYPDFYDRDLRRLFPQSQEDARTVPASRVARCSCVTEWLGVPAIGRARTQDVTSGHNTNRHGVTDWNVT